MGAAVGVALGVLILTVMGWLLWRRGKQPPGHEDESTHEVVDETSPTEQREMEQQRIELVPSELGDLTMIPQLDSREWYELPVDRGRWGMVAGSVPR